MSNILIYRHPDCAKCARIARTHRAFDFLGRVEDTTEAPPAGPLRMGQIVVKDQKTGEIEEGAEAFRLIAQAIPFYAPARLLLRVPQFRSYIEQEMGGCEDDSCQIQTCDIKPGRITRRCRPT